MQIPMLFKDLMPGMRDHLIQKKINYKDWHNLEQMWKPWLLCYLQIKVCQACIALYLYFSTVLVLTHTDPLCISV